MRKARGTAELGFTGHDRRRLATALHQAQETKVYQRVHALLLIAQGYSVDEVARIIGSQQRSVYYRAHRYLNHHRVADLYDASRTGRPRTAAQITKACILRELARSAEIRLQHDHLDSALVGVPIMLMLTRPQETFSGFEFTQNELFCFVFQL
jgi:hypothetical protein